MPSSMWTTRVFSGESVRPSGASTVSVTVISSSAWRRSPATQMTKSSAYLMRR